MGFEDAPGWREERPEIRRDSPRRLGSSHVAAPQKVVFPTPPKPTTMSRIRETACGSADSMAR